MAQAQPPMNYDKAHLATNKDIAVMLKTEGVDGEQVVYSEKLVKINRKGKKQERILLLTTKAVYNLKPKAYKISQRRVELKDIGMITMSAGGPEFAIHVPQEYDYHLASKNKKVISEIISELFLQETKTELLIVESELKHLRDIVLTKKLAKFEQQHDKDNHLKAHKNLMGGYSDADDDENDNDNNDNNDNNNDADAKADD